MAPTREPRLVLRFALASLVAFALVGTGGTLLLMRDARERAEEVGAFHARYVVSSVLAPAFEGVDLSRPVAGPTYERIRDLVRERVLSDGRGIRVKVWRPDGTIVFSDEPALVGRRFPEEAVELHGVASGSVHSEVSTLQANENEFERALADKLFVTYAPLRTDPGGPVVAVAELYQDYTFIQADIDAIVRRVAPIFGIGLAVLYAAVLPIALRASRELRRRNQRLKELLEREQETVVDLRDLHRKRDDFVAAASHELRTPLTSIIGYLTTLREPELGGEADVREEFLAAAQRQAKRLHRLVSNLLSTARLDGGLPMTVELVDLATLSREIVEELDAAARVRVDVPAGPVATDRGRIAEILAALLDNAMKYSDDGAPIEVGATVDADTCRLWVRDHGVGIDPADRAAIFERFHQVDQSATRRFGGLGLGLYVAGVRAEELGGRIDLESEPGRGSTFVVTIPTAPAPERTEPAPPQPSALERTLAGPDRDGQPVL